MKKGSLLSAALCGLALMMSAAVARADLSDVCPKIQVLSAPALYKYQASGHLAGTDRSRACSLIYVKPATNYPRSNPPMYDATGKLLTTFRAYSLGGRIYAARYYTHSPACSTIAATAKRRNPSRKAEGYIKVSKSLCLKVNNLYGRQGVPKR